MEQRKITSIVVVDGDRAASSASSTCTICGGRSCSRLTVTILDPVEARAARIKLLLFDVDGVLTDGTRHRARATAARARRSASATASRWSGRSAPGSRSGSCRRDLADHAAPRRAARHHARLSGRVEQARRPTSRSSRDQRSDRRRGRLHGRRHRRPGGAGARRPVGGAGRCGGGGAVARPLGQPVATAARGAARELIELILRAQDRWDGDRRGLRERARRASSA